jgi:hypothetical protein
MSLTKDEWAMMWESIKTIERLNDYQQFRNSNVFEKVKKEVDYIKNKIQSVVGQME